MHNYIYMCRIISWKVWRNYEKKCTNECNGHSLWLSSRGRINHAFKIAWSKFLTNSTMIMSYRPLNALGGGQGKGHDFANKKFWSTHNVNELLRHLIHQLQTVHEGGGRGEATNCIFKKFPTYPIFSEGISTGII